MIDEILNAKFSRRDFLKGTVAATAAVAGLGAVYRENALAEETVAPKEHAPIVDGDEGGKWIAAACWHNCGGRCMNKVLIRDGEIVRSKNKERHPRTVVGYDGEGAAYLVVVDGRQTKISNGGYLGDMSLLLREIGATDGINLDGGGSSTFLLNENGSFNVKNSPSDGVLRQDYNSLIVVAQWI